MSDVPASVQVPRVMSRLFEGIPLVVIPLMTGRFNFFLVLSHVSLLRGITRLAGLGLVGGEVYQGSKHL